ncbi:MAG TPA: histidine kinase, partial [Flavitalea sp.]|nr:histidine kinase [Flavitalea sp.]
MEYDNDRPIQRQHKTEILSWIMVFLFYPLINFFTLFYGHIIFLPILFGINVLIFPLYILYSKVIVPAFLFRKRYIYFTFSTLAFFIVIQLLLMLLYSFFPYDQNALGSLQMLQKFFSYSPVTIVRESLWFLVYGLFAIQIAFLKKTLDEGSVVAYLEKENAAFKLKYLRSQLNPHFLFNTLNSIYSLSLQKSDKAPEMVVKLADLMRYMIYDCNEDRVPLSKEIEFIRNYIDIEKIRHKADVRF